jgi:hypothetical protein
MIKALEIGQKVKFKLGNLEGEIIGRYPHNLERNSEAIWSGIHYPEDKQPDIFEALGVLVYDMRLPGGAIIRELASWELEAQ